MDIALKQRMVGASVLIALGVIFIPMVLEGPGSNGTQSVDLDIPPRNSRVLPVGDARPEPAEPVVERPVPNVARSDAEDARSDEPEPESTDPAPHCCSFETNTPDPDRARRDSRGPGRV